MVLADFGRDPRNSESWRAWRNFLSDKQRTILPISRRPNFTKFKHNTSIVAAMNSVGTEFWKLPRKRSFFDKTSKTWKFSKRPTTSGRHNSATVIHRWKFITKWSLYGKSRFHFYRWNQFKVIALACTLRTRNLRQIFSDVGRRLMAPHGT